MCRKGVVGSGKIEGSQGTRAGGGGEYPYPGQERKWSWSRDPQLRA